MYETLQTLVVKTTLQDKQSYAVETYYSLTRIKTIFAEVHKVWGWWSKQKWIQIFIHQVLHQDILLTRLKIIVDPRSI